jgi:predicted Zn-dependent protease with MMP-like domain
LSRGASKKETDDVKVSPEGFEELVRQALDEIPPAFVPFLANVVIEVEDMPSERDCASVGLTDRRSLLGLYHGIPLTDRGVEEHARLPDRITIYQRNIERVARSRRQLVDQIRTTVLHEVGHYFGLDEDELDELGYG